METQADEIKAEIERVNGLIARGNSLAESADSAETAQLWRDYVWQLEKRKAKLQERLQREEAPMIKPQPVGVKVGAFDV